MVLKSNRLHNRSYDLYASSDDEKFNVCVNKVRRVISIVFCSFPRETGLNRSMLFQSLPLRCKTIEKQAPFICMRVLATKSSILSVKKVIGHFQSILAHFDRKMV